MAASSENPIRNSHRQGEELQQNDIESIQQNDNSNNDIKIITTTNMASRKRGRPSRNNDFEWNDEDTFKLIGLWSKEELLYNTSDVFYLHRDFRSQALTSIYEALVDYGAELSSPNEVRNKMNNLRNYYAAEKRKETRRDISSGGVHYKSSWKFYDCLHFLKENYRPRYRARVTSESETMEEGTTDTAPSMVKIFPNVDKKNHSEMKMWSKKWKNPLKKEGRQVNQTSSKTPENQQQQQQHKLSATIEKRQPKKPHPVNSFVTVFKNARKNSKVYFSLDAETTAVETQPLFVDDPPLDRCASEKNLYSSDSSGRKRQKQAHHHTIQNVEPPAVESEHNNTNTMDTENNNKNKTIEQRKVESNSITNHNSSNFTMTTTDNNSQNLDKCYTDLIYQTLVSMPDSVEKAMLKLEFQQKLIKLKYHQQHYKQQQT